VLDILVQERRDQAAAERFLRHVLHSCEYEPCVVITDKLASYVPAVKRVLRHTEHRRHKRLNNRAENSHLPTRKRERVLQRFKSAEHAQRFLGPFSAVCNHFRPRTGVQRSGGLAETDYVQPVALAGCRSLAESKSPKSRSSWPKEPKPTATRTICGP